MTDTSGMNIAQRILHVGGRNNEAGYVEFGSIQAVEALVRQVLRDLPPSDVPLLSDEAIYEMYSEPRSDAEMLEFGREVEAAARKLFIAAPQPAPMQGLDRIAQLEAANTNLFEQGQKMHKRIQELEKDCKIGAQEMVKAYEEIDNLKAQMFMQEPVAWCQLGLDGKSIAYFDGKPMIMTGHVGNQHHPTPLFTAQPQRFAGKAVKLSDSEILTALDVEYVSSAQNRELFLSDARTIEQAVWAKLGVTE